MNRDSTEAERERQSWQRLTIRHHAPARRSATQAAPRNREEEGDDIPTRREKHCKAATASTEERHKAITKLCGEEAARVMATRPTRLPDLVLSSQHEATPRFHVDWTQCPEDWEKELRLRDSRNRLIRENFDAGKSVFYTSSGNSMWPLIQSGGAILLHPIRAVTAKDGVHAMQKDESTVQVGGVVFCQFQRSNCYYAHLVLQIEEDWVRREKSIGSERSAATRTGIAFGSTSTAT